jgi:hypothetical protein
VLGRARQSGTSPGRGAVIAVPPVVAVSGTVNDMNAAGPARHSNVPQGWNLACGARSAKAGASGRLAGAARAVSTGNGGPGRSGLRMRVSNGGTGGRWQR